MGSKMQRKIQRTRNQQTRAVESSALRYMERETQALLQTYTASPRRIWLRRLRRLVQWFRGLWA